MATQLEWTGYNTPDTAVAGASLNSLGGSGSYALGAAIDNTTGLFTDADLLITLSSNVTTSSGNPNIAVWILPSLDGTNYPETGGGASAGVAPINLLAGTILLPAATGVQHMVLRGIILPPSLFKVQIQNNLGVALPSSGNSCSLYRYRLQGV